MPPPKPPGTIPDPELPRDPDDPKPPTRKRPDKEPEDPAKKVPRVSPATRRPRPKEKPYEEDDPDVVE